MPVLVWQNYTEVLQEQTKIQSVTKRDAPAADELTELINECAAQSRVAQKRLYDRYSPVIYGLIRRYLYNETNAQEILNDTFYKIFTKIGQYSFQGSFEGWMKKIAVNTLMDSLRKNMRNAPQIQEVQQEDAYVSSDQVSQLSYKELLLVVHTLPDVHRAVFNLFVFENLSHREIAEILNINENNSRWHLNDARRRLKGKLNPITSSK